MVHDEEHTALFSDAPGHREHLFASLRIEVCGWFVHYKDFWFQGQYRPDG
jgi:hypothetical protein